MKVDDFFPPRYLKASDLQGRRVKVIIEKITTQMFPDANKPKPVLYFKGKVKGLPLNMTNAHTISGAYGPEMETWLDKPIVLYPTMVEYQGQQIETIRIEIPHETPKVSGLGDDVF
jgi:hypothetical protein